MAHGVQSPNGTAVKRAQGYGPSAFRLSDSLGAALALTQGPTMNRTARSRATAFGSLPETHREESGAFPIADGSSASQPATFESASDTAVTMSLDWIEELEPDARSLAVETEHSTSELLERVRLAIKAPSASLDPSVVETPIEQVPAESSPYRRAAVIAFAMILAATVGGLMQWVIMTRALTP